METLGPEITDYELERGKPTPSQNHGIVQANMIFELKIRYRDQFRFMSEINVEIAGRVLVPDIGIFEPMKLFRKSETTKLARVFDALPPGSASPTRGEEGVRNVLREPYRASETLSQAAAR